ncbi:MAG: AtpZ/AtpI family protein [Bacteroidales bacterium]|nr:AtpZ/AtpI family protein [Bacteroidales bacterium]
MKRDNDNHWIHYSTLGIEMAVIIGAAVWGGVAIDRHRQGRFPAFTILMAALGFVIATIRLVRSIK